MEIGKNLIILGLFISLVGVIFYLFVDKFNFLGNLIGDFKYESKNIKFFAPITSMLIISLFLSLIINIIIRFFR
mgnify:CR=1 FL=1